MGSMAVLRLQTPIVLDAVHRKAGARAPTSRLVGALVGIQKQDSRPFLGTVWVFRQGGALSAALRQFF